jgi:hypothetical protein
MLEKLLKRIASRGPQSATQRGDEADFVVSSRGHAGPVSRPFYPARHSDWSALMDESVVPSNAADDWPPSMGKGAPSGMPNNASNHGPNEGQQPRARMAAPAWPKAVQTYRAARADGGVVIDLPTSALGFGAVHAAVAAFLQAERAHLPRSCVRITQGVATLAVVHMPKLAVQLYTKSPWQAGATLQCAVCDDAVWAAPSATAVQTMSIDQLLWLYGQAVADAVAVLPQDLGASLLQLRKFPLVDPQVLEMRHLGLMHIFSTGAMGFAQLCALVPEQDLPYLCADLASLQCCGALAVLPQVAAGGQVSG